MSVEETLRTAVRFHGAGRTAEAEFLYRKVLAVEPNHAPALHSLGVLAGQTGKLDVATTCFRRAVAASPGTSLYHSDLGRALLMQGLIDEAIDALKNAAQRAPDDADVRLNIGTALLAKGNFEEAVDWYQRAVSLAPGHPYALNNLGLALANAGRPHESEKVLREAIRIKSDCWEAYASLGKTLYDLRRLDDAADAYREALRLNPRASATLIDLGNALKDTGCLDEAIGCFRNAMRLAPNDERPHGNLVFTLQYHPDYDAEMIRDEAERWANRFTKPLEQHIRPHTNDRNPERRLRIGYVSSDFKDHCQSLFTIPLFSHHDRSAVETFCYANVLKPDAVTERIRGYVDHWRSIARISDQTVAETIRDDRIDILVDLTMHMAGKRLTVFARKPAPIQVTWLAYPGTTGLSQIDYRLTDPFLDPPGMNDELYTESSIRLSDTFWCYDPLTTEPEVNSLPATSKGYVTFGCLNNFCKVNQPTTELWAQVLKAVERSRLLILAPEGSTRQRLGDRFEKLGVDRDRVECVSPIPRGNFLQLFHRVDLGLDTFPYNGHTTSLDSFWMGVPVVSLVGKTVVGRAGLSQLMNLGLPELVARTPEEYVQIAIDLAHDLPRLDELRRTLRTRMRQSPLMDGTRFARSMEAAYRHAWRKWCEDAEH